MSEESLIQEAVNAARRLEEANKVTAELVKRQEKIEQSRLLGGHAEAGVNKKQPLTEEEKNKQDMKEYFKGTAIEKAFQNE